MPNSPHGSQNRRASWRLRGVLGPEVGSVLVVEDDVAVRESLCEAIQEEGCRAVPAANGLEALDKLRWGLRPYVILLDMQMHLMTGWEFRTEQRKDAALADIPVVAMTAGYWQEADLSDYAERLRKPIHPDSLLALLQRFRERADQR